jgi:hypothetical protein
VDIPLGGRASAWTSSALSYGEAALVQVELERAVTISPQKSQTSAAAFELRALIGDEPALLSPPMYPTATSLTSTTTEGPLLAQDRSGGGSRWMCINCGLKPTSFIGG